MKPYHSRGKDDWGTPQALFDYYQSRYSFGLDIAASAENTKCEAHITAEKNALTYDWYGSAYFSSVSPDSDIFGNPPYSLNAEFVRHAWEITEHHSRTGADYSPFIVLLVPARTDTKWWHDYVMAKAQQVEFIKGRICFEGAAAGAPFPSAIVIYNPAHTALKLPTQYVSVTLSPLVRGFTPKGRLDEKEEDGESNRSEAEDVDGDCYEAAC